MHNNNNINNIKFFTKTNSFMHDKLKHVSILYIEKS